MFKAAFVRRSISRLSSVRMTTYETTWSMPQAEVNRVTSAKQWNSFALQVDGSGNPVTWIHKDPDQIINISLQEDYGAFVSSETDLPDGTILKVVSRYPIELGSAYSWNGSDMVPDMTATCEKSSVRLVNNSSQAWTFGMTKLDPVSQKYQPICCDLVLQKEPVTYTPQLTIYAKVGRYYRTSSIVADIGDWTELPITGLESSFHFDVDNSKWT